jgi:hypothetical protein
MARTTQPKVKIVEVDDPEFVNAYGGCFQASTGEWTGSLRSSRQRAQEEADAYLASIAPTPDEEPAAAAAAE